ncbi:MAG: hypothetical protein JW882_22005 [Deltaproteobacteria bacterium]|nr:hypothetical protein [Deltaproteobacteria bacterium]
MVAHPNFLKDLRALIEKYRSELRMVFLKEDFSDGNLTRGPKWQVISGEFKITPSMRLRNSVFAERPAEEPAQKKDPDLFGMVLKEVLKAGSEKGEKGEPTPEVKAASIRTKVEIGPDFEVDVNMVSESKWGSMEMVLLGGETLVPLYRMVYNASPSSKRPIQIYRERDSRSYLIDEAVKYPSLEDGTLHRIQWIRDAQGKMKVLVDEKEILSTVEAFYNENFSGFAIVNNGGIYEWGPIVILEASPN